MFHLNIILQLIPDDEGFAYCRFNTVSTSQENCMNVINCFMLCDTHTPHQKKEWQHTLPVAKVNICKGDISSLINN